LKRLAVAVADAKNNKTTKNCLLASYSGNLSQTLFTGC